MDPRERALDWLLDKINLDPKFKSVYIDTKHQLADMLTKGNFTRDEWNNLLHLSNIRHFSSTCCTKHFSWISCSTMAKRIQNQKEERVVSKSRPAVTNMSSFFIATRSSAASSTIAFKNLGMPIASGKPDSRMSVEPSSFDPASTSQVRLKDAYLGGLTEEQRGDPSYQEKEIQKTQTILRLKPRTIKEDLLPKTIKLGEPPLHTGASSSVDQENSKEYGSDVGPLPSNIAGHIALHGSRLLHGQEDPWKLPGDPMEDLNVNLASWGMFMNTTLRAAVHLGNDHDTILRFVKNRLWKTAGQLSGKQKS